MAPDDDVSRILQRAFPGCQIHACTRLDGGVSARAVVVELTVGRSSPMRVVVRRPSRDTPQEARLAAEAEYRLLRHCTGRGLSTPKPIALDREASAVVLEYVAGSPDLALERAPRTVSLMAEQLATIHHSAGSFEDLSLVERYSERAATELSPPIRSPDLVLEESRLRGALSRLWPWPQDNPDVLLHGDYWPGNLLWKSGELVTVLDWEEAAIGDPLVDVAIARLDVLWAFGQAAMHAFTQRYREQTQWEWRNLARWDLLVALRPMSNLARWASAYANDALRRPDVTEVSMREGHRYFVGQAFHSLGIDT